MNHKQTPRGEILFTTVHGVNMSQTFVRNLVAQFNKFQLADYLVIVVADPVNWKDTDLGGLDVYTDPTLHGNTVISKWQIAERLLSMGFTPFFFDFDMGFIKNPLLHVPLQYDAVFLSDKPVADSWTLGPCPVNYGVDNPCFSTGLWRIVPTPATFKFVSRVSARSLEKWEQEAANQIARDFTVNYTKNAADEINFGILPMPQFTNAVFVKEQKADVGGERRDDVVLVHCGYTHGLEGKSNALREQGIWNV